MMNKWLIEDVAWTLKNFQDKIVKWEKQEKTYYDRFEDSPYMDAARAALIVVNKGFGCCYPIDDFKDEVKDNTFTTYDGTGVVVDEDGNKIEHFNWRTQEIPDNAKFIMWYNK